MFDFQRKNQFDFGVVSAADDRDIEVQKLKVESRQGLWLESMRLLRDIILIIAVFILFGVFVAQPVVVEGTSMLPQLHDGERLLVNKLVYYKFKSVSWGHIERGDVIVFWYPKDPEKSYVKRVIGLPGETVQVLYGRVLINNKPLAEPYRKDAAREDDSTLPVTLARGQYWVMGDNRENSFDSRVAGPLPGEAINGRAIYRLGPFGRTGSLKQAGT